MNGVFDVKRGVERDIHVNIRRENDFNLLQLSADALGDVDGIGVRLFDDAESDCRLTAETGDRLFYGRAHLDRGNVPEANRVVG